MGVIPVKTMADFLLCNVMCAELILDNYLSGPTAPYNAWVILEKTPSE